MTVDYVQQMLEIQRGLLSKAESTKTMWQDDVARRYYSDYIDKYDEYIYNYLQGNNIKGMGLESLLEFFERKAQEMSQLTGCPNPVGGCGIGEVHDSHLNRNMDGFDRWVPNPDYLDDEKVHAIEEERTENDEHNRMQSPFEAFGR